MLLTVDCIAQHCHLQSKHIRIPDPHLAVPWRGSLLCCLQELLLTLTSSDQVHPLLRCIC